MRSIFAAAAIVVVSAAAAHAQDASHVEQAKAKYKEGVVLYNVKEYAGAIDKFKEAYKLDADPAYLYNIAQAYRLSGDCENAVSFYKTFLRDAPEGTPNVDKAQKFLGELAECVAAAEPAPVEPEEPIEEPVEEPVEAPPAPPPEEPATPTPTSTPTIATTSSASGERGSGGMRLAGLVSAGAGVLAAGTGVYFGLQARGAHDDLVSELAANGGVWNDALESKEQDAQRDETLGLALTIGGAAAAVAGGVLYYLGRDRGGESPVTVTPTRGGATIAWACDF